MNSRRFWLIRPADRPNFLATSVVRSTGWDWDTPLPRVILASEADRLGKWVRDTGGLRMQRPARKCSRSRDVYASQADLHPTAVTNQAERGRQELRQVSIRGGAGQTGPKMVGRAVAERPARAYTDVLRAMFDSCEIIIALRRLGPGAGCVRDAVAGSNLQSPLLDIIRGGAERVADFPQGGLQAIIQLPTHRGIFRCGCEIPQLKRVFLVVEQQPRTLQAADIGVSAGANGAIFLVEAAAGKRRHAHVQGGAILLRPPRISGERSSPSTVAGIATPAIPSSVGRMSGVVSGV